MYLRFPAIVVQIISEAFGGGFLHVSVSVWANSIPQPKPSSTRAAVIPHCTQ